MSEHKKTLFLLDAMALVYRAYFALNKNPRINSKGVNTSAALGFANTLYELLKKENPSHIGVAFDTIAPTVRHEGYAEYKAHRQDTPEDIISSLPYIKKIIEAFNIPILFVDGYEADDVIGTLAQKAEKEGFLVYMMTPDKDFGQLVSKNILIYKPARMGEKPEILGVDEICKKYELKQPKQLIEILGLWGDASDNIPGVPGIGEVTSKKLIKEYGNIENLLQNTDKLSGKLKENLEAYSKQAFLSRELATIITDVPIEFKEEKLHRSEPNTEALKAIFDELEFRTFAKRVFTDLSLKPSLQEKEKVESSPQEETTLFDTVETPIKKTSLEDTPHQYHLIDTPEKRKELIEQLVKQKTVCFDTETTGIDPHNSELVGMSFSYVPHEAYYVPMPTNYNEAHSITHEFKSFFENPAIEKVGQNLKYDIIMLKWYDVDVKGKLFDTMLAHYLLQPDLRHNLDYLADTYLHYTTVPIEALIGKKGKNQLSMLTVPIELLKDYAAEDADVTLQLKDHFSPLLKQDNTLQLFENIETPLIPVLVSLETEGIKVDKTILGVFSEELDFEIKAIEKDILQLANTTFNVSSPKQLGEVLFDKMHIIDNPKKTKTKQYSTDEDSLAKISHLHPIIPKILDYRSLTKLKSTYVDALPAMINARTGRVHTSFNQAIAATGRLSSNNPNLQNIPIRTEKGREIRKAFVPRNKDYILLSADYSQIELRIIAELSGDEGMLEAFHQGLDIHTATAAKVYGVALSDVTSDMRRNAKTVNFGIIYGISAFGLSERLQIPRKEAAGIIQQYFEKYPKIKQYMEDTIQLAKNNGYVETIMKRRRYLRDIHSSNATVRGFAERNAINAPIQGSAADMIKVAMINIYDYFTKNQLKSKMVLQVHDELVFDAHKDEVDLIKPIIKEYMCNAIKMNVPIEVDINTGENWLKAH